MTCFGPADKTVSCDQVKLSTVFKTLESNKAALGISDWGIEETALEEVFLHLTDHPIAVMEDEGPLDSMKP